jgi:hypothetical protein
MSTSTIKTDTPIDLLVTKPEDGPYRMLVGCEPFKLSYMDFDPDRYDEMLRGKVGMVQTLLDGHMPASAVVEVCPSVKVHYRLRSRFAFVNHEGQLLYAMWERGKPSILMREFPIAAPSIYRIMPRLLGECHKQIVVMSLAVYYMW